MNRFVFQTPVLYLVCSLIFLPSFAAGQGTLNENIYIKQFAFYAAFAVMMIVSLFMPQKSIEIHITWGDLFAVALPSVYLFFYLGTNNDLSFTLPFIGFLLYSFIRIHSGKTEEVVHVLTRIVPVVMLLHVVCCLLQFFRMMPSFHGYFQVGSTFGNPDMLGAFLAVLSPFCYIGNSRKIFGMIVLCLTVIMLFSIQARTAIVAITVPGFLYLLLSGKLSMKVFFCWILTPAIAVLVLLVWWHPASVAGRLFIWLISLNMFVSHPVGWGLYAFEKHYPEYQADYLTAHNIPAIFTPDIVHFPYNEFLNVGVTLGVGGLLLYLLFIVFVLFAVYKARSPLLYPVCSILTVSMTYFPLSIVPVAIIGITVAALAINQCPNCLTTVRFTKKRWLIIPILATVVLLTWNNYHAYRQWQIAVTDSENGNYSESNNRFVELYPAMKGNGRFLITWANVLHQTGDSIRALLLMEEAEQFFCDNIFLSNLASLYERNGQIKEAERCFDKAVNMVPDRFNIAYERILFLQRIGSMDKACQEAVKLYHQPIRSKYYADPFIIKAKLEKFIQLESCPD